MAQGTRQVELPKKEAQMEQGEGKRTDDYFSIEMGAGCQIQRGPNSLWVPAILKGLDHIKPKEVSYLVIAGGVNDLLKELQRITKSFKDPKEATEHTRRANTIKAVRTYLPNARVHMTKIANHPKVREYSAGKILRNQVDG